MNPAFPAERGEEANSPIEAAKQSASTRPPRQLIIAAVFVLHVAALALIVIEAIAAPQRQRAGTIRLFLTAVGLLMAHCSLFGIWWARSAWPLKVKTPIAVLAGLAVWGVMMWVLDDSRQSAERAAGWAAGLATQFLLTAFVVAAFQTGIHFRDVIHRYRFTILSLFIWTTLVGSFLGGARWLAARIGWSSENFFAWNYFEQLQVMGLANALLAVAILGCTCLHGSWRTRGATTALTLLLAVPLTIGLMWAFFGGKHIGSSLSDLAWLTTTQGVFLAATILPLEIARAARSIDVTNKSQR